MTGEEATAPDSPPGERFSGSESPGSIIGRYKLRERIGEGGWGTVYVAEQEQPVRRRVALKILNLGLDTRNVVARFEAERQALALMDHPNIAKVLDAGAAENGRPFFVMELVRGIRITDYCDQSRLTTSDRLKLFIDVCHAVQHAHQKGIIHRDLKPSNILVTMNDGLPMPKVIDFGIAKATQGRLSDLTVYTELNQFIGTPAYMSPEQAEMSGLDIDTRSDIYSLGILLYELLTGKTPFDAQNLLAAGLEEMRLTIREKEPARPSTRLSTMLASELTTTAQRRQSEAPRLIKMVRGDLDWIVMKAIEKDRTRRYESASGFAADLQRHLRNEPVVARPPSNVYRLQKMVRRNKLAFAAGVTIATLMLFSAIVFSSLFVRERFARQRAVVAEEKTITALRNEAELRREAERTSKETRETLSTADFTHAVGLVEAGKQTDALAYLVRSLSVNPENSAALVRLTTLLTYNTWMVPKTITTFTNSGHAGYWAPGGGAYVRLFDAKLTIFGVEPSGAVSELEPHGVVHFEFSRDGKSLAALSSSNIVRVWDPQTAKLRGQPVSHHGAIATFFLRPDGKRFAASSVEDRSTTLRIWDITTGLPLTNSLKHSTNILAGGFTPDGARVATATMDGLVMFWHAHTFSPAGAPITNGPRVMSLDFTEDGALMATAGEDGVARIWDLRSRSLVSQTTKADGMIQSFRFSPNGQQLVTGSSDGIACVWDVQRGQPVTSMAHEGHVNSVEISAAGDKVFTASWDGSVRVWNKIGGDTKGAVLRHAGLYEVQLSADAGRVITASTNNSAFIWEAKSGLILASLLHAGPVLWAAFNEQTNLIVTASADGTAQLWDAHSWRPVSPPLEHYGPVRSAQFSPNNKTLLTVSSENLEQFTDVESMNAEYVGRFWNLQTGAPLGPSFPLGIGLKSVAYSANGDRIVSLCAEGLFLREVETGKVLLGPLRDGVIWGSDFWQYPGVVHLNSPGTRIVTVATDDCVRVWDATTGQLVLPPIQQPGIVWSAQFSPDGKRILTAAKGSVARIWDAETGRALTPPMRHSFVSSAQFSAEARHLLTVGGQSRLWDARSGLPVSETFPSEAHLIGAQLSRDLSVLLTGGMDGTVQLWSLLPSAQKFPSWLPELATTVCGGKLNESGLMEPLGEEPNDRLNALRHSLNQSSSDDKWSRWGKWLLADPATRSSSSFASVSAETYRANAAKNPAVISRAPVTPEFTARNAARKESVELAVRGHESGRKGDFKQAKQELGRSIELNVPERAHLAYLHYAALLAYLGDSDAYDKHREIVLSRFGNSTDPLLADRMGKALLLAPAKGTVLKDAFELAQRAVNAGSNHWAFRYFLFVMAFARLNQPQQARAAYSAGVDIVDKKLPRIDSADLGEIWHDLLIAYTLKREAEALLRTRD